MAYRFPLVVNNSTTVVGELQSGDSLNLTLSGIYDGTSTGVNGQVLKSTGGNGVVWGTTGDVFLSSVQTLSNKTFSSCTFNALTNTISNIPNSSLQNSSVTVNGVAISLGGSTTTPDTNTTYSLTTATSTQNSNAVTVLLSAGGSGGANTSYDITGVKLNVIKNASGLIQISPNLNTLTFGSYLTGTSYNPGTADATISVDATPGASGNVGASKVVARDASGNFYATKVYANLEGNVTGNVTGNLTGTADIADKLLINGANVNSSFTSYQVVLSSTVNGNNSCYTDPQLTWDSSTNALGVTGSITGGSFIKSSGTSSQFLKADGSVDSTAYVSFAAGTTLLFYQASAPTGWTQVTTQNNKALRIVSGTGGGTGGTSSFTTVFASRSLPLPDHTHGGSTGNNSVGHTHTGSGTTSNQSSNHTHGFSGTTGTDSPDHSHNYTSPRVQNAPRAPGPNFCNNNADAVGTGGANQRHSHGFSGTTTGQSSDHSHTYSFTTSGISSNHTHSFTTNGVTYGGTIGNTIDFAVQYIDVIMCSKN